MWKNSKFVLRILKNVTFSRGIHILDLTSTTVTDTDMIECALDKSSLGLSYAPSFSSSSHEDAHLKSHEHISKTALSEGEIWPYRLEISAGNRFLLEISTGNKRFGNF